MVRGLSSTLRTAINANSRTPALQLSAQDHLLHYASYQSPGGADGLNDACVANDGSIVRINLTRIGDNAFTQTAYVQRITDPSVGTQWASWSTLPGAVNTCFQDGGCALSNNNGTLRAFAQQGTGGNAVWTWTSTDNGATWTGPVTVLSPPSSALTKGIGSAGNNDVFFLYDVSGGEAMGFSSYNGTSWSALTTWTLATLNQGLGVAAVWNAVSTTYTLVYSDGYSLLSATYVPGTGWTQLPAVAPATSTAIGRISPRLSYDSTTQLYTLCAVDSDSGTVTGAIYNYPRLRQSSDLRHWSNGVIVHGITVFYGANAFRLAAPQSGSSGTRYYVTSMPSIYSAQAYSQSNAAQYLDLSAAVLSYTRTERESKPSRLEVTIDNNKGVSNSLVNTGGTTTEPLGPNTSLVLAEGYKTGTPPTTTEVVKVGTYHIASLLFERTPDQNHLRVVAYDLTRNLDLVSRYQMTYTTQTLTWLISEITARAGLFSLVLPTTSQMSQVIPVFVLHAGQRYRACLDELCNTYALSYYLDQDETLQVIERSSGASSVWTYQPEIELVAFGTDDVRGNHIIVSGKPPVGGALGSLTTAEAYDDAHVTLVGLERVLHYTDQKLTTTAQCQSKASFLLAQEQRDQVAHTVTVPANPALQLLDSVTLTDSAAPTGSGQSGTVRILQSAVTYEAQRAVYEMQLHLEGA